MPKALGFDEAFGPLHRLVTGFADPLAPSSTEEETLWYHARKLFHARATDSGAKKFKRALIDFPRETRKFLGNEFLGTAPRSKSYVPQRLRDAKTPTSGRVFTYTEV